jgi:hypothetical protein
MGGRPAAELALPVDQLQPACRLDKAWPHFAPFFKQVAPQITSALSAYGHSIAHRQVDAAYWQPLEIIWLLTSVHYIVRPLRPAIPTIEISPKAALIQAEAVQQVAEVLTERAQRGLAGRTPWLDDDGFPFDAAMLGYVVAHFSQMFVCLTRAINPERQMAVIRISS